MLISLIKKIRNFILFFKFLKYFFNVKYVLAGNLQLITFDYMRKYGYGPIFPYVTRSFSTNRLVSLQLQSLFDCSCEILLSLTLYSPVLYMLLMLCLFRISICQTAKHDFLWQLTIDIWQVFDLPKSVSSYIVFWHSFKSIIALRQFTLNTFNAL